MLVFSFESRKTNQQAQRILWKYKYKMIIFQAYSVQVLYEMIRRIASIIIIKKQFGRGPDGVKTSYYTCTIRNWFFTGRFVLNYRIVTNKSKYDCFQFCLLEHGQVTSLWKRRYEFLIRILKAIFTLRICPSQCETRDLQPYT